MGELSVLSEVLPDWPPLHPGTQRENEGLCPSECITFEGLPTYFWSSPSYCFGIEKSIHDLFIYSTNICLVLLGPDL